MPFLTTNHVILSFVGITLTNPVVAVRVVLRTQKKHEHSYGTHCNFAGLKHTAQEEIK